jgi:hypothetical protein
MKRLTNIRIVRQEASDAFLPPRCRLSAYNLTCRLGQRYDLTRWSAGLPGLSGFYYGMDWLVSVVRILSLMGQLGPLMVMNSQWGRNLSRIAVARTSSDEDPIP